jgi:hypothetical protein
VSPLPPNTQTPYPVQDGPQKTECFFCGIWTSKYGKSLVFRIILNWLQLTLAVTFFLKSTLIRKWHFDDVAFRLQK